MREEIKNSRSIIVLGSTGSVGTQALDVALREGHKVKAVSADKNVRAIEEQVRLFGCEACAMADERAASELKIKLADTSAKIYSGKDGIVDMIFESDAEVALNSIIGEAGLMPTISALNSGKQLALANKESLVVAGEVVMSLAKEKNLRILPVDSEHCAIYQCLEAGKREEIKRLILTASGGPFFGKSRSELEGIAPQDALAHPTWNMGAKITIDSATLMNKGFEVIEAAHLFGVDVTNIEVVVQRESIIHSMVEYIDNSIIAQLSVPDMRLCVQYALSAPRRNVAVIEGLDFDKLSKLTFAKPDTETFVLLKKAIECMNMGGAMPAVLNAANEVAVSAFLSERIGFTDIFDCVSETVDKLSTKREAHSLDEILNSDREAREVAMGIVNFAKRM
ncbi:MAG: 1-deoxy-D-xylulose-5-phosphate reductoisomerase [Clostridia bacterium]|nr:1-deoxy-D-xylulose-5-phosphate reductoisomerase [Clostridia bacterium]